MASAYDHSRPAGWPGCAGKCGRHRQLVGLRSRWCAVRTAYSWLRRSGDAGDLGSNLEGLGAGKSILGGGHSVTAE